MSDHPLTVNHDGGVTELILNDPDRRNALTVDLFAQLDAQLGALETDGLVRCVLLRGEGRAFCAGFDLAACVQDDSVMPTLIQRLSKTIRMLRRLPQPIVAAVHGAAIAGGCALLSGCDFVVAATGAKLGYPVHRIGVSPAVTLPTLMSAIGPGRARALVMTGSLIDGAEAYRLGLATHLAADDPGALDMARSLAASLASKPPSAIRTTKSWLNELEGALENAPFEQTMAASASAARSKQASALLRSLWGSRR